MSVSINGTNGITFNDSSTQPSAAIGTTAQTWQVFTVGSTRVLGTTYTNSTGRPIQVIFSAASAIYANAVVNGVSFGGVAWNVQFIVPTGATYSITCANSNSWMELR